MKTCEPTDNLGLSDEFLADEDIARDADEDSWRDAPKCGGPAYEDDYPIGCPGCRHCSPPDHECKPYGFGIERFEDPALLEANEYVSGLVILSVSMYRSPVDAWGKNYSEASATRRAYRDERWLANSRHNKRLELVSERIWDRLADECETHRKAVEKYTRWAEHVVASMKIVRDEP